MKTSTIVIMILCSILCATGIVLIMIACIQYSSWWPLMTIFFHSLAILTPVFCGGCASGTGGAGSNDWSMDTNGDIEKHCGLISWLLVGIFSIFGYAVPSLLLRKHLIAQSGLLFTFAGGTTILIAILIFTRVVYFSKSADSAYVF
jgi:hypothetical protein